MRNKTLDIIKGVAIILMVYGHTFGMARDFIYLFHMPIFILISGYCWNEKHSADFGAVWKYCLGRFKRLMVPYYVVNIIFVLLNNVFLKLNFYTNDPTFKLMVVPIQKAAQGLTEPLGKRAMLMKIWDVITLQYIPQMGSASWFLVTLFAVCSVNCVVQFLIGQFESVAVRRIVWIIVFIAVLLTAGYYSDAATGVRFFAIYSCYLLGIFLNDMTPYLPNNPWIEFLAMLAAITGLYGLLHAGTLELSKGYIINPAFFMAASFLGYVMLTTSAHLLQLIPKQHVASALSYVGTMTMEILFMHLLAFKLVSVVYLKCMGLPDFLAASWPVLFDVTETVKLIYTVVGVLLPVGIVAVYRAVRKKIK